MRSFKKNMPIIFDSILPKWNYELSRKMPDCMSYLIFIPYHFQYLFRFLAMTDSIRISASRLTPGPAKSGLPESGREALRAYSLPSRVTALVSPFATPY